MQTLTRGLVGAYLLVLLDLPPLDKVSSGNHYSSVRIVRLPLEKLYLLISLLAVEGVPPIIIGIITFFLLPSEL